MRLIAWELCVDTQSVRIIWGTHAEYSVNTWEHKQMHDTQSEEWENMIETLANQYPNRESFCYQKETRDMQGNIIWTLGDITTWAQKLCWVGYRY
jgi:hypothetical protein